MYNPCKAIIAAIAIGLLSGAAVSCSIESSTSVPKPITATTTTMVGLIDAQQCLNYPEGEPVPNTFDFGFKGGIGVWSHNGIVVAESRSEDIGFYVCGSPELIADIAAQPLRTH